MRYSKVRVPKAPTPIHIGKDYTSPLVVGWWGGHGPELEGVLRSPPWRWRRLTSGVWCKCHDSLFERLAGHLRSHPEQGWLGIPNGKPKKTEHPRRVKGRPPGA